MWECVYATKERKKGRAKGGFIMVWDYKVRERIGEGREPI